jgi:hypothetical protein
MAIHEQQIRIAAIMPIIFGRAEEEDGFGLLLVSIKWMPPELFYLSYTGRINFRLGKRINGESTFPVVASANKNVGDVDSLNKNKKVGAAEGAAPTSH